MPLDDGCRFDQHHGVEDLRPDSEEPRPEQPVGGEEPRPARALPTQDGHLVSQGDDFSSNEARLRTRNESREPRADRSVIMPMKVWLRHTILYTCSAFRSFEQAQSWSRGIGLKRSVVTACHAADAREITHAASPMQLEAEI